MEDMLVNIYLLYCYSLNQPRTEGIASFILKWPKCNPTPASVSEPYWVSHHVSSTRQIVSLSCAVNDWQLLSQVFVLRNPVSGVYSQVSGVRCLFSNN